MTKSWKTMMEEEEAEIASRNNLMIVDGTNLAFRCKRKFSSKISSSSKSFSSAYTQTLQSLAKSYSARTTIVLGDRGRSVYRTNIFPEYKANRNEKFNNRTEEEKIQDEIFFENLKEAFKLCETIFPTFLIRGVEADDMAAFIKLLIGNQYDHVWLISSDGDWDTLLDESTSRFSFITNKEYHIQNIYEDHGVDNVDQYISLKAIMGDTSDGIRGVEGIGVKRGYNIIREYGNVLDIIDQLPLPGRQAFIKNLNNSEELLLRNLELVDLPSYCADAIAAVGNDVLEDFKTKLLKIAKEGY